MSAPSSDARSRYARVLSIAGSDSGGGAGIQADLKTFAALGCYGMTAITAVTAQNTLGVAAVHGVPAEMVAAQVEAVVCDIGVDAVKIGMLLSADIVRAVSTALRGLDRRIPVVLDTVMVSSSGRELLSPDAVDAMVASLFPMVHLVTPNLDEAARLLHRPIGSASAFDEAADDLLALGAPAVLLKGGHLPGDTVVDLLAHRSGLRRRWSVPRIDSHNLHGTGCTLSAAVAAHLALGRELSEAVALARGYVLDAIVAGAGICTGRGRGPLNHGQLLTYQFSMTEDESPSTHEPAPASGSRGSGFAGPLAEPP